MVKSTLFAKLPDYVSTPDGMAIDFEGNLILACPNYADQTMPGCIVKIDTDKNVKKWFDVPVHEETGLASPMGIAFGPDGDLYICDNQGWPGKPELLRKGRILRVRLEGDKIVKTTVVAKNMEHPNGMRIKDGYIYVTPGYSDMAIGLGEMFGFHFLENFNYPYISTSITEFWRRWHISLSTWFRDYIYIPLGGNRVNKLRWLFNIFVVWALTGFWHGAEWNFIAWGLFYAVLLILEKLFLHKLLDKLPKFLCWIYAMVIVLVGWVLFNLTEPAAIIHALSQMFSFNYTNVTTAIMADTNIVYALLYIPLGVVCMFPWKNKVNISKVPEWILNLVCLALLAICIVFIIGSTYNPFIYFRF